MAERISIVPATAEDVKPFYGGLPPYRLRAYAGKLDGKVIGLGGLYFLPDGTRCGFLVLTEEGYKYPRVLYRATFEFLAMLRDEGVPSIRAVADPTIPKAAHFLRRIGFQPIAEHEGQTIYLWRAPVRQQIP